MRVEHTDTRTLGSVASPLELRIFNLPSAHAQDAVHAAKNAVTAVAARNEHLALERWYITIGDPSILNDTKQAQSSARIRFTAGERQRGTNDPKDMEALLDELIADGFEAYWSSAMKNDKRNQGVFYFTPTDDAPSTATLSISTATNFINDLC